jgi:hypothetical protein
MLIVLAVLAAVIGFGMLGYLRLEREERADALDSPVKVPMWVDPSTVQHHPRFRFSFDPPEALARFRIEEQLDQVVASAKTDEQAFRLLNSWTSNQWEQSAPNPYPPPDALVILSDIRAGRTGGFCAQYSFVLSQAIQSFGAPARLVTIRGHIVVEAWLRDEGRWVVLDPAYDLQVVDEKGSSLNAFEIRTAFNRGDTLALTPGHSCPFDSDSYLDSYDEIGVWIRNDFISRPINYNDIPRYLVWYDPPSDLPLAVHALRTSFAVDLWDHPSMLTAQHPAN